MLSELFHCFDRIKKYEHEHVLKLKLKSKTFLALNLAVSKALEREKIGLRKS